MACSTWALAWEGKCCGRGGRGLAWRALRLAFGAAATPWMHTGCYVEVGRHPSSWCSALPSLPAHAVGFTPWLPAARPPASRAMLFFWYLGLSLVYGCELDAIKAMNAQAAVRQSLERVHTIPYRCRATPLIFHQASVEEVLQLTTQFGWALPAGVTILFSFWEGIAQPAKQAVGLLVAATPSIRMLVLVEHGWGSLEANARSLSEDLCFPEFNCVCSMPVTARGGSAYTCYFYQRA